MRARKMSCRPRKPHFMWMKLCKGRSCPQKKPYFVDESEKNVLSSTETPLFVDNIVNSATNPELLLTQSFRWMKCYYL